MKSPLLKKTSSEDRYSEFKELIFENKMGFHPNISQSMVAENLGISPQYLASVLAENAQKTFPQILNEMRIKRATEMLNEKKDQPFKIIDVAREVGYSSRETFNRAFKKVHHMSPGEFLKRSN